MLLQSECRLCLRLTPLELVDYAKKPSVPEYRFMQARRQFKNRTAIKRVFLVSGAQLFRVQVEGIEQVSISTDPERIAKDFMLTLPYEPDL